MPTASGETFVAAPHPAGAKLSVAASIETITAYEEVKPLDPVPLATAEQRFDGYYPRVQSSLSALRTAISKRAI
jgi:hypothetical protein